MLGERLKRLRKMRGFTANQVAEMVGIARSTYAGYESDHRQPPLETLQRLASVLNTSTDYLIGLTDNPFPKEPTRDINKLLREKDLHFNGVPLSEEELKPLRDILEIIVRERLPKIIEQSKDVKKNKENEG